MTVEANFNLYSCTQRKQLLEEYYKVYTSTMDTINANGVRVGLYPTFKYHFSP